MPSTAAKSKADLRDRANRRRDRGSELQSGGLAPPSGKKKASENLSMLCKPCLLLHSGRMRCAWSFIGCGVLALLASCSTSDDFAGGAPQGTGPFDSRGNYVEAWADNPSKWRRRSASQATTPPVVQPPVLASNEPSTHGGSIAPPEPVQERTLAKGPKPKVSTAANTEQARSTAHATTLKSKSKSTPEVASRTTKSKSGTTTKSKKSSSVRVTVGPGDSLWSLAKKHHTTVDAIKKANGLKSDMIRDGKKLVIPRR
jgi:LysM repeat protein